MATSVSVFAVDASCRKFIGLLGILYYMSEENKSLGVITLIIVILLIASSFAIFSYRTQISSSSNSPGDHIEILSSEQSSMSAPSSTENGISASRLGLGIISEGPHARDFSTEGLAYNASIWLGNFSGSYLKPIYMPVY
ncbi:MAG: hypothetical protein ACP5NO_08500, partial [Thermoplasmata archaeon]